MSLRQLLLVLSGLLLSTASLAQVYRWVDENGKVHYSDKPPASQQAETVRVEGSRGNRVPANEPAESAPARPQDFDPAALDDPLARKQCELARSILENYLAADALVKTGPEGEKHQLTEEEKARTIEQARANMVARCTPRSEKQSGGEQN